MVEHALAVLDFAAAQAARTGAVQTGRMGFEADLFVGPALEAYHHGEDANGSL